MDTGNTGDYYAPRNMSLRFTDVSLPYNFEPGDFAPSLWRVRYRSIFRTFSAQDTSLPCCFHMLLVNLPLVNQTVKVRNISKPAPPPRPKPTVTSRFGPIPVRTPGRFGPIPFRSGRFGLGRFRPISGVGRFDPILVSRFGPIYII